MNQGNMIGCVAADLRKAFDVIAHEILLKKRCKCTAVIEHA